jgi:hypothetical protein
MARNTSSLPPALESERQIAPLAACRGAHSLGIFAEDRTIDSLID